MNAIQRRAADSLTAEEARHARAAAMWGRFCRLMARQGKPVGRADDPTLTDKSRLQIIRHALNRGEPRGWRFGSHLEAADVGRQMTRPVECEPTDALPGTPEKVIVMTERAAGGKDLWHKNDAVPSED